MAILPGPPTRLQPVDMVEWPPRYHSLPSQAQSPTMWTEHDTHNGWVENGHRITPVWTRPGKRHMFDIVYNLFG